jgi:protein TonB
MRRDPATTRQGACLLLAMAAHGLALSLLPMPPASSSESGMPAERVISARLLSVAPAPASPAAMTPEPPQSAPPPPARAIHETRTRPQRAPVTALSQQPAPSPEPAPLLASHNAAASFTVPATPSPAQPGAAPSPAAVAGMASSDTGSASSLTSLSTTPLSTTPLPTTPSSPSLAGRATTPAEQAARPDYAYNPKPEYPPVARQFGLTGRVMMRVLVEPDGAPREIVIANSSGHDMLDQAALRSVRAWRFVPARRAGEAHASWVEFPVRFELTN